MKEVYHCTPKELDKQEEKLLDLHYTFLMEERQHEIIESKRAEQRNKTASYLKKKK